MTLEQTKQRLRTILAAQRYSRTSDYEGRRIEPSTADRLLNGTKYRKCAMRRCGRNRTWDAQARHRQRQAEKVSNLADSQPRSAQAEAEAEGKETSTTTAPNASRSPPKANGRRIKFDFQAGAFEGIGEEDELRWQEAFPAVPVPPAIAQAAAWLKANPANRKSNYERFLVNWFKREQDKAARVGR